MQVSKKGRIEDLSARFLKEKKKGVAAQTGLCDEQKTKMKKLKTIILKIFMVVMLCLTGLTGSTLIVQASAYSEAEVREMYDIPDDISIERQKVLVTALSLVGKIPYDWGGKPQNAGWNERWDAGGGLDCSGFVQWVYWTALGINSGLGSTGTISGSCERIKESDLQPGDLGLMYLGSSSETSTNHVGIYMGNGTWIHCTAGQGVIVDSGYHYFKYFVRPDFDETPAEEYQQMVAFAQEKITKMERTNEEIVKMNTVESEIERLENEINELIKQNQQTYFKTKKDMSLFGIKVAEK